MPNEVKFGQLADVLSLKFHEAGGRHLTEDHKRFLAEKIVGKDVPDPLNVMVSWFKFSKEHLEGKTFTFWEWFYAILKLTKDHLSELWRDDLVIGFVTRQRAEELLSNQQQGSFLIRFSDTSLGVISIALKNAQDKCLMVGPLSAKELKISKIADSIRDLEQLQFLYPGIPKNEAFSKYYTRESPQNSASNGYVRPLLRPYIPGYNWHSFFFFDFFSIFFKTILHGIKLIRLVLITVKIWMKTVTYGRHLPKCLAINLPPIFK